MGNFFKKSQNIEVPNTQKLPFLGFVKTVKVTDEPVKVTEEPVKVTDEHVKLAEEPVKNKK